jgi:hypothetical protein
VEQMTKKKKGNSAILLKKHSSYEYEYEYEYACNNFLLDICPTKF